ncbi:von Willebrand factor A domain-containing protein 7-like [Poecilia latipinna]|uniref:von Willebrand factor A domain-containing protein 7-like n=1 Tax=Poecilia latipinna TaxID=48699 RepID=UPI00072DE127|nr:PREDICTED: von Willebrand factor A domain-containing protein 7-like [Poecilia latipinna]XP_014910269.1 PREDICTED: von Willebrand factor A domain-containing protein 7-like [Poecilia latipinna]
MIRSVFAVLCFILLHIGAQAFEILPGDSLNHQEITEQAILNATVQACRSLAQTEGTSFNNPAQPFTAEGVAASCSASQSSKAFRQAITSIKLRNIRVDIRYALKPSFHFDEEEFVQGRRIITDGMVAVKADNRMGNYETAREKLGEIMHPLQDFYSHSNWVELGNTLPNSNLIKAETSIGNIADQSRATCRSCVGNDCTNNILEDIIAGQILTSGYFGLLPFVSTKPPGKCSHGGSVDQTSKIEPTGGINKDSFQSSHGHLHTRAANLAVAATSQLLEDIRLAAGDLSFLQLVGISRGSSKALCFVTDTSKSMSDDIEVVKTVTSTIINIEVGTENEPSVYILVPFNDPGFGPVIRTTDATLFKDIVNHLTTTGGGDVEEMSLSGLQLALTSAPFNSEIFLFTDAPAKDKDLKNTVIALIERTQTVVNFMITDSVVTNRRRRRNSNLLQTRAISESDAQLYRDLAQASGGQAIEVTKAELPVAAATIVQSVRSSLVTLLQASRNPGQTDSFTFIVDETVINPTVYITGRSLTFTLTSPTGVTQESTDSTGSLITSSETVGNFITVRLLKQVGQWAIRMVSNNPYTLRVVGESSVDFLFDFVEPSQGPFGGFDALDTRPKAGVSGTLLVTLSGSDSAAVTEVALVESTKGSEETLGVVSQGSGNFLVQVDVMPTVEFVVRVKGRVQGSATDFQRQSPTNFRASNLTLTANSDSILTAGTMTSVPFTVASSRADENITIRATNSRNLDSTFPTVLLVESGNSTNGTVTLLAPLSIPSGSDVILTIVAETPDGSDTNYIVLRFSVVNSLNDFTQPACQLLSMQSGCVENCSLSAWVASVRVTDGDSGAGVERVSLIQGTGVFNTSLEAGNENVTLVSYVASCCAPVMQLLVVDRVGNVGTCQFTARDSGSAVASLSFFLCLIIMGFGQLLLSGFMK